MKVIFLDFNGVLDTYYNIDEINIDNLNRLKNIVDKTNAKIVISSSLKNNYYYTGRISKHLESIIKEIESLDIEVIGFTPLSETREEEIKMYLDTHNDIDNYCIIDDDYDMEYFKEHMVKLPSQMTVGQTGLDDDAMNKAIEILNSKIKKYK